MPAPGTSGKGLISCRIKAEKGGTGKLNIPCILRNQGTTEALARKNTYVIPTGVRDMKLKALAAISLVVIAGCATTSPVVPLGHGKYEITGSSLTTFASGSSQRVKLIKVANDFCTRKTKEAVIDDGTSNSGQYGSNKASADVQFHCE